MAQRYGNRWENLGSVGEGGQGHAFRVRDLLDGSTGWVLKRLKNGERVGRFEAEVRALQRVSSPHVLRVVDFSVAERFLVTPYVGKDLASHVLEHPLVLREALGLLEQVVAGVAAAHGAGVAHRDIKPSNVLVSHDGTVVVADFGLCQIFDDSLELTTTGELLGTAAFAAPECMPGSAERCAMPSDIYSLGKLLYWMTSGGRFIPRESVTDAALAQVAHTDPWARHYVRGLLDRTVREDPRQRVSATQLLDGVRAASDLVGRLERRLAEGQLTIWDGLWVADGFSNSSSRSTTMPAEGGPAHEVASAFDVPDGHVVRVEELAIGARPLVGGGRLRVAILGDQGPPQRDGRTRPDPSRVVAAFDVDTGAAAAAALTTIRPTEELELQGGSRYWVAVTALTPGSRIAWWGASEELTPLRVLIGERSPNEDWQSGDSLRGPGYALRILGRVVA